MSDSAGFSSHSNDDPYPIFFLPLHPLTRLSIPQRLLYVSTFETGISNSIAFLSLAAMIVIIGLCVRLYLRQVILTIN